MKKLLRTFNFSLLTISLLNAEFIRDDNLEVVTDTTTGFMWQDNSEAKDIQKVWAEAIEYCENLTLSGYSDWKLPTIGELETIADISIASTFVNTHFRGYYWSSTISEIFNNSAFHFTLNYGVGTSNQTSFSYNVVCIRDGEVDNLINSNTSPTLSISSDKTQIYTNETLSFTSTASDSDGTIASYNWDFGDGSSSTEANPIHTYTTDGTFYVNCTVADNDGATTTQTLIVTVNKTVTKTLYSDSNTGLMWEDGELNFNDWNYSDWYEAKSHCENLEIDGYSDFRVPNIWEITSLNAIGIPFASTTITTLPDNQTKVYITGNSNADWEIQYFTTSEQPKDGGHFVKCVRGNYSNNSNFIRYDEEKVVYDSSLKLIWQDDSDSAIIKKDSNTNEATEYCNNLTLAGFNDWRLPTVDEIITTYDFEKVNYPRIKDSFINISSSYPTYFTSERFIKNGTDYGAIVLQYDGGMMGSDTFANASGNFNIRCVRNGEIISNIPPILTITASKTSANIGQTISFTSTATDNDGNIESYSWTFGDEGTSKEANPNHTYTTAGIYTVTCTVTDNDGATTTETLNISVSFMYDTPPVLIINSSKSKANIKESISFSSSARDGDGYIKSYNWFFGDGEFSNEENPTHFYEKEGNYTVACTVTDNDGATTTETLNINITKDCDIPLNSANLFPKDDCSFKDEYEVGEEVEFTFKFNQYGDIRRLPTVGSCKVLNSDVLNYSKTKEKIIFEEDGIGMLVCAQNNIVIRIPFKVGDFELEPNNALIVVGKGSDNDKLKEAFKTLGNQVYQFLYSQGYRDDEIIYFNAFGEQKLVDLDFDGNSDNVVDSSSFDESDIKEAIENMPKSKNPILIYLIDHGKEGGGFMIDNENTLTVNDLNNTLNSIDSSREVIVVVDSCYSGEFVEALKGENRVIISSGTKDELIPMSDTGLSFTNYFLKNLQDRKTLKSSFEKARDSYTKLVKNAHPQVNFNSDIAESPFGYLYDKIDIIKSYTKELKLHNPQIKELTLNVDENSLIDKEKVEAYIVITPPQKIILDNENNTNTIEIVSEKRELFQKDGLFIIEYNFNKEGVYQIYYEIIDSAGDKYSTDTTTVQVGDSNKTIEYISKLNVKDGWNLLALPSKTSLKNPNEYFNGTIYTYKDLEWDINLSTINYGIGFWLKSTITKSYQFEGEEYKPTLDNLNDWYLLGTGKNLNDGDFKSDIVWVFRDEWIQTKSINKGEGFWLKRSEILK